MVVSQKVWEGLLLNGNNAQAGNDGVRYVQGWEVVPGPGNKDADEHDDKHHGNPGGVGIGIGLDVGVGISL